MIPSNRNYAALLAQGLSEGEAEASNLPNIQGFEIIKKLGDGGMGEVYLAYDSQLDREVALKIFHTGSLDPMSLERIRQESEIMAKVQHPHVLAIYHVKHGSDVDTPFSLVLEYAAGGDLADKIRSAGALSLEETVSICLQICDGLSKIHELGIIHRDIKPANILLTKSGTAKVADLGIAKDTTSHSLTMTGTYMGSLLYVAPEQTTGSANQIDGRADIWSMGILIYEMLVGNTPKAIIESELMEPLPESIRPVVRQCLMQNPENRYQSVVELKEALIRSLDPINMSMPESMSQRPTKTSPLNKIIVIAGLTLALVTGVFYFLSDNDNEKKKPNQPNLAKDLDTASETPAVVTTALKNKLSLIDLLNIPLQPDRGNWSLSEDGKLSCEMTPNASCISFPVGDLGNEYDLTFDIVRTNGANSLAVYLPTSCGTVTFELDAWNMELAGIQTLDGLDLRQHDQTFKFKMTNGENYQVMIKVRKGHVEVIIDDKKIYHCDISDKTGSIIKLWDVPRKHPLSIGSWNSAMTLSDLILKKNP